MQIFVHYPGQMLRSVFGMDRIYKRTLRVKRGDFKSNQVFEIVLNQMTVLKKRADAIKQCNPDPTDDKRFWDEIFNRLTCLPSYWKHFLPKNTALLECKTLTEFETMANLTQPKKKTAQYIVKENIVSSIATPCNEMKLVLSSNKKPKRNITNARLKMIYHTKNYQEIKNERAFGMDSLWSNIGGFAGMFIGYSLLNLLDDGFDFIAYRFKITH